MIEKQLEQVINEFQFIPHTLQTVFAEKVLPENLSIDECWNEMSAALLSDAMTPFWENCCFFDRQTSKELLSKMKPAILTACLALGIGYISKEKTKSASCEYFYEFDEAFLIKAYGEEYIRAHYSQGMSSKPGGIVYDVQRKFDTNAGTIAEISDPNNYNPYITAIMNAEFAALNKRNLDVFFPELVRFVQDAVQNITTEKNPMPERPQITQEIRLQFDGEPIRALTPYRGLLYLLLSNWKYLPGGYNTRRKGGLRLYSLNNLDNDIREQYNRLSLESLLSDDIHELRFARLLTEYGIEDLLHLNRTSAAMRQYLDYMADKEEERTKGKELKDKEARNQRSKRVAQVFSLLVYAPTSAVQDFIKDDMVLLADVAYKEYIDNESFAAFIRVLAINSVIFPSLTCILSRLLFLRNSKIEVSLIESRLSRFSFPDGLIHNLEGTFRQEEKVWQNAEYFSIGKEYKQRGKKSEQDKFSYVYKTDAVGIDDLPTIMLSQKESRLKNAEIITIGKMSKGYPKVTVNEKGHIILSIDQSSPIVCEGNYLFWLFIQWIYELMSNQN